MTPVLPQWFEISSLVVLGVLVLFDLGMILRRPHVPSMREAGLWLGFYVGLAFAFGVTVTFLVGEPHAAEVGTQFFAGWLTEYSLSIDNIFVFIIIFKQFHVPKRMHQELLLLGILLALVLRAIFIIIGAGLLHEFSWLFYVFGGYLVWVAISQLRESDEISAMDNPAVKWLSRFLRVHPEWRDEDRWRTDVDGRRMLTPAILVFSALGIIDLLFALDSIPAIFGITTDWFLVLATNIFALMGLRQLYFLLGGLMDRLRYLGTGVAVVLGFIGLKLVADALHENEVPFINGGEPVAWAPNVPTWVSLVVIVVTLTIAVLASVSRRPSTGK